MSNYPHRPFFYNLFAAFRPYATHKPTSTAVTTGTTATTSHTFTSTSRSSSNSNASPSSPHAQITQTATARAIASKSSSTGQAQGFAQAAAAFSPSSQHHAKHTSASPGQRTQPAPYGSHGLGGRARRGSESSGDEGFVQRPGADKWLVGGKMGNGEERFYKLSMVRRERSNDRKSCDRMSL